MTETTLTNDADDLSQFQTEPLPKGLNVLTILTIIGCSLGAIFTIATPWIMKFSENLLSKAADGSTELSPKQIADLETSRNAMELTKHNMVPLIIIGLVGIVLCFVGAIMMRKLKKDGFWIYTAGQVVPIIGNLALMGMAQFTGVTSYFMFLIPFIFIFLYSRQRKFLVN